MPRTEKTRTASRMRLCRAVACGIGVLLLTVALTACGSDAARDDTALAAASTSQTTPQPSTVARTSGNSLVVTGDPAGVALRGCPAAVPDQKAAQETSVTCLPLERLRTGTSITMRCWTDSESRYAVPEGFSSRRWFYVTDVDGPHPGWSGYVYSDLVDDQIVTPGCTPQILARHPFRPQPDSEPPVLRITGSCSSDGGMLSATSSGFTPGLEYTVSATYPGGTDYPLDKDVTTARQDGSVAWSWECAGDPAGTYTTEISTMDGRVSTGPIPFTIDRADPEPTNTPDPSPSVVPVRVQVTVSNLVTDGAGQMREDDEPAYLSSRTVGSCRLKHCEIDGTKMSSGAVADAVCQLLGDRITNGQNDSAVDDENPGLFSSARWYGIRWPDGRQGYLSEVFLEPSDRGGRRLPDC